MTQQSMLEVLVKALSHDNQDCMHTPQWVKPSTARLVGVEISSPISLGELLQQTELFAEKKRLLLVDAVIISFLDDYDSLPKSYMAPLNSVDLVEVVSKTIRCQASKAKMLIFSLAHKDTVSMYVNDDGQVCFYTFSKDLDLFLGMLPIERTTTKTESFETLMYRQLSDIINYRLRLDFDMILQASKAAAEINEPIIKAKTQVVPSVMSPNLEPKKVLSRQKAGGRLVYHHVSKIQ